MPWNWQLSDWPKFNYEEECLAEKDRQFFLNLGGMNAFLKNVNREDYDYFLIEILCQEGEKSSKIEGEILDRESLQSSIKRHFGIHCNVGKKNKKEAGMAELLCDIYESFEQPLTHEMLWRWHAMLFKDNSYLDDREKYRTHPEPMQIVSHRYDRPKVFFEAPPSNRVFDEMTLFINWFNSVKTTESVLGHAAIAHVYFESIHPFEDGNGRIGRALVEKLLSWQIGRPILIAVSKVLEQQKKAYYAALEKCNCVLTVDHWVTFFSDAILCAQEESIRLLNFLIEKAKILTTLSGIINLRQEKVLIKMFESGPSGFKGGLSAGNYIAITHASRATTTRDLADLVQMGALKKTGELRHTRYWLNLKTEK